MARIVFITQAYDPASTILGVTRDWVRALAERAAGVDVIALSADPGAELPSNVRVWSLGKERRRGRAAQTVAFYRALAATLPGASAVLAHMVPRYAVLAYPLARAAGRRLFLWYAQGGVGPMLRLAGRLVDGVLTPTRDSFPLRGPRIDRRVVVTGHGIDTERYAPDGRPPATPRRLLAVGRLSPSKRYEALLDALALLEQRDWALRVAGPPLYASDRDYEQRLRRQAESLALTGQVAFLGDVPYERVPDEYRAAWLLAHTSGTGSLDKVVLEAMACATPVVSTAPSTRSVLGVLESDCWCPPGDPRALSRRLQSALDWTPAQRQDVGAALRYQVTRHHSLAGWADRVAGLATSPGGR